MQKIFLLALLSLAYFSHAQISTPQSSSAATITQSLGLGNVTIKYSRPMVNGRKIFGNLVPYGKIWRTGANQITSIKLSDDLFVNGKELKAGSYGIYTIPNPKTWTIIFNTDDQQWGAYGYVKEKDVLRVDMPVKNVMFNIEQMEISLNAVNPTKAKLRIGWEKSSVELELEQRGVHEKILNEITEKTAKSDANNETIGAAAEYYFKHNMNLDKALAWSQKITETEKQYWNYQLVARIAAKMGNCAVALPNAEKSLELATKENDDAYIMMNKEVIKQCKK